MTQKETLKAGKIMIAWARNPKLQIEFKGRWGASKWEIAKNPSWNWNLFDYRIKE